MGERGGRENDCREGSKGGQEGGGSNIFKRAIEAITEQVLLHMYTASYIYVHITIPRLECVLLGSV